MNRSMLKENAKGALKDNWGVAILVLFLQSIILGAATGVCGIGQLVFVGPIGTGVALVFLKLSYRDTAKVEDLFQPFNNFVNTFFAGLLVSVFTFLWTLLFIVPGIIKGLSYSQTFYIMNEHPEYTGTQAIDASRAMMDGHKGELFLLQLSFIGWFLLCIPTLGLIMFYVGPYYAATMAEFHRYLLDQQNGGNEYGYE